MRAKRFLSIAIVLTMMVILMVSMAGLGCHWVKKVEGNIFAAQTIDVGDYSASIWSEDPDMLHIVFTIASGWCLVDNHIAVAVSMLDSDYVNGKDNPKIGKFPYEATYQDGEWVCDVDLDDIEGWNGGSVDIAIHVVVKKCCGDQSETGWGEGDDSWGSRWGWYFDP
jgi:hypothetical protein